MEIINNFEPNGTLVSQVQILNSEKLLAMVVVFYTNKFSDILKAQLESIVRSCLNANLIRLPSSVLN